MEELRSTEILDKEIQEDARRKASRILNNGEIECANILEKVNIQFEKITAEKKQEYESKIIAYKKNKEASFPLEKQRFLVEFENNSIDIAIKQYLEKLNLEEKIKIINQMLKKFSPMIGENKIYVEFSDFDIMDIQKLLELNFSKEKILKLIKADKNQYSGIVITTEDNTIKCRVTIEEKISELKELYTEELALALFGGRMPE